ncbi:MAG: VRR-NUC domain-containing protein, partial [Myxococcota bacterium]
VRPQLALRLDREGRRAEAVAVCREPEPDPAAALALERTGRRLARGLGWAPREPLRKPRERVLRLPPGSRGARPTWVTRGGEVFVEAAVLARVADAGREALHAENWLWTSLYALVFRDLYFLPVPGMLPGPRRSGPLDVGTPGFWTRRREAVERRLAEVRERGPAAFAEGWQGERLDGLGAPELAVAWSRRVPGATAAAVLTRLVKEGWAAARGLPDLYVLPGPEVRVGEAVPSTIGNDDLLAEVKGPGDDVSDAQRVWHDHLLRSGIRVEIWRVAPGSPETT